MKKKLHRFILIAATIAAAAGLYACGEKSTFQVSSIEEPITNVELAALDSQKVVVLNEERTARLWELFDGVVYEQTQSAGSLTGKYYSLIFLNGGNPVDSLQISEDGRMITYGGYFYQCSQGNFETDKMRELFEEQAREGNAESIPELTQETQYAALSEAEDDLVYQENKIQKQWIELAEKDFGKNRLVRIDPGMSCRADLDGDGQEEEFYFAPGESFSVQGKDYLEKLAGEWCGLQHPEAAYYVADVDKADSFLEIALEDREDDENIKFHFFQYEDGALRYAGAVSTDGPYDKMTVLGDKKIVASGKLSVLQDWSAPFTFVLSEEGLAVSEEEWYYPYVRTGETGTVKMKEALDVYEGADLESAVTRIEPTQDVVTFGMTDNKNWVQFYRADGATGWIYLKDGEAIVRDGETLTPEDVFENLNTAQ